MYKRNKYIDTCIFVVLNNPLYLGKHCAEFSYGGNRIQGHFVAKCKECPAVYNSDESFKCKFMIIFFDII